MNSLALQQFPEQLQRGVFVAALLDQHIQHLAFVINSAPEPHPAAADLHDHLIQMPPARRNRSAPTEVRRDQRPKLVDPAADRLTAHLDSTLSQQFLDVPDAQGEAEIEPHRVADDLSGKAMAFERKGLTQTDLRRGLSPETETVCS